MRSVVVQVQLVDEADAPIRPDVSVGPTVGQGAVGKIGETGLPPSLRPFLRRSLGSFCRRRTCRHESYQSANDHSPVRERHGVSPGP